ISRPRNRALGIDETILIECSSRQDFSVKAPAAWRYSPRCDRTWAGTEHNERAFDVGPMLGGVYETLAVLVRDLRRYHRHWKAWRGSKLPVVRNLQRWWSRRRAKLRFHKLRTMHGDCKRSR